MANDPPPSIIIPDEIREKFKELVDLIIGSESMNDEERQYWINILPIMTPEQLENLNDILTNEKTQLQEIEKKYAKGSTADTSDLIEITDAKRSERREQRAKKEGKNEENESKAEEDILRQIEGL